MKKILQISLIVFLSSLYGCTGANNPAPPKEDGPVSIITGKPGGVNLTKFLTGGNQSNGGMPVNALLWRAALEIASFAPLSDVDTFGGTIVTDWYSLPDKSNERMKLAVFVIGRELRSDAVSVRVYIQNFDNGLWSAVTLNEKLGEKIKDLILTRARELRSDVANNG